MRRKISEVRPRPRDKFGHFGLWLSLVERLVRDERANKYAHFLPRALTCFFIGKTTKWNLSHLFSNALKKLVGVKEVDKAKLEKEHEFDRVQP